MSMAEWKGMGAMMGGIGAMGGPATALLAPVAPAADSAREMPMPPGMTHARPAGDSTPMEAMPDSDRTHTKEGMEPMLELQRRMLADPVIRKRVEADTVMQRLLHEAAMVPESGGVAPEAQSRPAKPAVKAPGKKKPAAKPKPPMPGMKHPAGKPMPPMPGMKHP